MFRRFVINPIRRKLGLPVHYRLKAKGLRLGVFMKPELSWAYISFLWRSTKG